MMRGTAQISPVIFEMFVDVKSAAGGSSVLQQGADGGSNAVPLFIRITRVEDPGDHQGIFSTQVDGKYFYAVAEDLLLIQGQLQVEFLGVLDRWCDRSI